MQILVAPEPLPPPRSPAAPVRLLTALRASVLVALVKANRRPPLDSTNCELFDPASVTILTQIILEIRGEDRRMRQDLKKKKNLATFQIVSETFIVKSD